jgi:putative flippase GtrA
VTSLGRRVAGYSAGSVIAAATSEAAFVVVLGWLHGGTTWASAAGFVGGAVPNYILNRRWAWSDRRGRDRRTEVLLYAFVAVTTFLASAFATHWAQEGARQATSDHGWTVFLTALAFLGVSGVFFVLKFVLYEHIVFVPSGTRERRPVTR